MDRVRIADASLRQQEQAQAERVKLPARCATGSFDEFGGDTAAFDMALTKRAYATLVKRHRLRFRLTIAATDFSGNSATQVVPLELFAPSAKKRATRRP